MADARRTLDYFLNASTGVFKDANEISAQMLRDFVLSLPVALSIQTIGDGDVTDQGDYNDFQAVNGVLYAIDIADIMTLADDNNTRVIFPATPAEGDTFGFFVKTQSNQAGSFAQAPGYCVEPADGTLVNNVAVSALTTGGSKWSLWLESEILIFRYVDATVGWQVVHDGRQAHTGEMLLATATAGGDANQWNTALFDTAVSTAAKLENTTNEQLQVKRANPYLISWSIFIDTLPNLARVASRVTDGTQTRRGVTNINGSGGAVGVGSGGAQRLTLAAAANVVVNYFQSGTNGLNIAGQNAGTPTDTLTSLACIEILA